MNELERALMVQVATISLVAVVLAVAFYYGVEDAGVGVAVFGLLFSGAVAGAYALGRGFQQKQWPLLMTLPVDRSTTWLLIMAAHAAAASLSILTIVLVMPSVPQSQAFIIPVVLFYIVLFCAAQFFALTSSEEVKSFADLVRRMSWREAIAAPMAFIGGLLHLNAVLLIAYISVRLGMQPGQQFLGSGSPAAEWASRSDMSFAAFASAIVCVGYLVLARLLFVRGENRLQSVRMRFGFCAVAFSAALALVFPLVSTAFVRGEWDFHEASVSNDGRRLAVVERAARHPAFGRINLIDLQNTAMVRSVERKGILSTAWNRDNATLSVLAEDWAIGPLVQFEPPTPPPPRFVRWVLFSRLWPRRHKVVSFSDSLEEIDALQLDEIVGITPLPDGRLGIGSRAESSGSLLARNVKTGATETLASGPTDTLPALYVLRDSVLFELRNLSYESSVWRVDDEVQELQWETSKKDPRPRYLIDGTIHTAPTVVNDALRRAWPPPSGQSGAYLISSLENASYRMVFADASSFIFYIQAQSDRRLARLLVFDRELKEWIALEKAFRLSETDGGFISGSEKQFLWADALKTLRVDNQTGIAAYALTAGDKLTLRLYDARNKRSVELGEVAWPLDRGSITMKSVAGGVLVACGAAVFAYQPDEDRPQVFKLAVKSIHNVLHLGKNGTHIYHDGEGKIFQRISGRPERLIWPQ